MKVKHKYDHLFRKGIKKYANRKINPTNSKKNIIYFT